MKLYSGLRSQFSEWPAGSAGNVLSFEVNGQGSRASYGPVLVTFHLQFFRELVRVSRVRVQY